MSCQQMKELLVSALYEEEISAEERRQLDAHLAVCAACREELASFTVTRQTLAQWAVDGPPESFVYMVPGPAARWSARFKQFFGGGFLPVARLGYRAAAVLLVLLGLLALLDTKITWGPYGIAFHTRWSKPAPNLAPPIESKFPDPDPVGYEPPQGPPVNDPVSRKLSDEELWQQIDNRITESQITLFKKWLELTEDKDREQDRQARQEFLSLRREVGRLRRQVQVEGAPSSGSQGSSDKN